MDKSQLIASAIEVLQRFGIGESQQNNRSAMTLLALLNLKPGDDWNNASNPVMGTRAIMDWIRDYYGVDYKPNTRETICRFTLHQFVIANIVEENSDEPNRPINSPKWNYRVSDDALRVMIHGSESIFEVVLKEFLENHVSYTSLVEERKNMPKTPVLLPSGTVLNLSPSGQSVLIKDIVEEMLPRFAPGCRVVYIDDTDHNHGVTDVSLFDELGINLKARKKAPDVIAWDSSRDWLFIMEAASTHGPVDVTRKNELKEVFANIWDKVVLVSCFPNRKIMQKYLSLLAWETEAWCADTPDHMVHFDGLRFMGPYEQ